MDESESKMSRSDLCSIKRAAKSRKVPFDLPVKQRLPDGAALLHHLGPVEPRQFAEPVIAVDDGPLHDLGVAYEEAGLCRTGDRRAQSLHQNLEPAGPARVRLPLRMRGAELNHIGGQTRRRGNAPTHPRSGQRSHI